MCVCVCCVCLCALCSTIPNYISNQFNSVFLGPLFSFLSAFLKKFLYTPLSEKNHIFCIIYSNSLKIYWCIWFKEHNICIKLKKELLIDILITYSSHTCFYWIMYLYKQNFIILTSNLSLVFLWLFKKYGLNPKSKVILSCYLLEALFLYLSHLCLHWTNFCICIKKGTRLFFSYGSPVYLVSFIEKAEASLS